MCSRTVDVKGTSGEGSEGSEEHIRVYKYIVLENTYIVRSKMLVGMLLKVLVKTWKEMRNMILGTGERLSLLYSGGNLAAQLFATVVWNP